MKGWREKALIGSVAVIVAITFIIRGTAAFFGIPILDGDATFFSPCIHNLATGVGFTHPFVEVIPNNPGKLCIWHGWLYPYLAALLPWSHSYQTIGVSNLVLCIFSLLASAIALFLISKNNRVLATLLCLPIALLVLHQVGRPELVVTGLVASAAIVLTTLSGKNAQRGLWGALLGITATASPSAGVSYALVTAGVSAIRSRTLKDFLLETSSVAVISILTLLVVTSLFAPISLEVWLNGILTNAKTQYVIREGSSAFITYYFLNPSFPLLAIYLVLGFLVLQLNIRKVTEWRKSFLLFLFSVLTAYVSYMAIRLPEANYNFMLLIPAILFASAQLIEAEPVAAKWLRYATIGASGVAAIALIYLNLTTLISLTGVTQPEFAAGMKVLAGRPGAVRTDAAFSVPLAEVIGYKHVNTAGETLDASYIVLKQANSAASTPPHIPGFRIMVNRFIQNAPSLFGIKIANTRRDWSYAIYCRSDVCP